MNDASFPRRQQSKPGSLQWRSDPFAFFLGFLRRPFAVAAILPSSRFLEQRLADIAAVQTARIVVELGPGTGGTTRALLSRLPEDARLLAIELDPRFAALLMREPDPRLIVHIGNAEALSEALAENALPNPDVVISGIPFSTMPTARANRILAQVWSCLEPGGCFVAYQYRDRVAALGRKLFGKPDIELEMRNAPPTRIYRWRKPASPASVTHG